MYYIGSDIGGMSIKTGIVTGEGQIIDKIILPIVKDRNQDDTMAALGDQINELIARNHLNKNDIKGIGVGCPGSVDSGNGICDFANNLHWWKLNIAKALTGKTGIPCKITNDANAAALGEAKFGGGKGYKDLLLITLGTGVGGGIVIDGKLYEGNKGKGAELGHTVIELDGRPCSCGRKGCLEAYASVTALIADTKAEMEANPESAMWDYVNHDLNAVNGKTAFDCAQSGDESAQKVVDQYVKFLGEGLLNFINAFRPEAIILGGGLSGQKEGLTGPVKAYLAANGYGYGGDLSPKPEIFVSNLGNDAGILGAASLVL